MQRWAVMSLVCYITFRSYDSLIWNINGKEDFTRKETIKGHKKTPPFFKMEVFEYFALSITNLLCNNFV
jgi:hypothetical protein